MSPQCWVALLQVPGHEWLQPNICHHNVGWHCFKYLCVNDYSQISVITMLGCFVTSTCGWMITTGTWWTESGYPASWEAQISVITMWGCFVTSTCAWMITAKYVITTLRSIVTNTCGWLQQAYEQDQATQLLRRPKYLSSGCQVALLQAPVHEWLQQAHVKQDQATQLLEWCINQ